MPRFILRLCLVFVLAFGFARAQSPSQSTADAPQTEPSANAILQQWHGSSSHTGEFSVTVLYGAGRWRKFWRDHLNQEEPGGFDDSRHRAVLIELGVRPTGGYAVEAVSAYQEDNKLVLEYVEVKPAPNRMVTQALTNPWVMVMLPRSDFPVVTRKGRQ